MSNVGKILFGFVATLIVAIAGGVNVDAFSSNPKTFVSADNTFYAYVESGEKLNINFTKVNEVGGGTINKELVTVIVNAPGMDQKTCTIAADAQNGQGCNFKDLIAVKDGIWQIVFKLPDNAHVHNGVVSSVKWGANHFNWNITVSDSVGERKGRLWSELYAIVQPAPAEYLADLMLYYQSEDGYLYRVTYRGYNGQISTLSADAFGIVEKGTCTPAYVSSTSDTKTTTPSFGSCGGSYKLFFEQPSDDLPHDAARWDGKKDWIRPLIDRPIVEGLSFVPDKNANAQSGEIKYRLKNFIGQYEVKIDTNADGNYDGSDDITLRRHIKDLKNTSELTVKFDGTNRSGNTIPRSQHIKIKIRISKAAEIHLVGSDIEGREGGVELVRLSGDNAPSSNIYWNDTELTPVPGGLDTDLKLDGTEGPESIGGVHKWKYSTNELITWGNARYIDDWTYATTRVSGVAEIEYPTSEIAAAQTTQRNMNIGLIIIGGIVLLGVIGGVIYVIKRRRTPPANLLPSNDINSYTPPKF